MIDIGLPWVLVSALPYVVVQTAAILRQILGLRALERLAVSHPESASLVPDVINAARPKGVSHLLRHRR